MTTQSPAQPTPYPQARLAAQPIGYWTGAAYREVVGRIRTELATESLTQPHWWVLNHVAAAPAHWTRTELTAKLTRYDDQGIDFGDVFDDLASRDWLTETASGTLTLTEAGEAGRLRARERNLRAHEQMHAGITEEEYVATLDVLRRVITNLGGDSDLPE
ncbi:MarR family transcriptional regulator [Streptomyces sp. Qhu-G9]|uniref:MarR family transcriptional regulator n=1 Tax=Streptomyces sp. Qhu-G9 TaxID=3452799 RepID=UPI0022AC0B28|nr:MarR family transcriptional regulator [Streptomyces aurantiacus]WAU85702.1 MarR family transcriptional regulator [Streptomyces aurantiacus]